jgi:hypothetical protein
MENKPNIDQRSSEVLAAIIVAHRSLGSFEKEARESMVELMIRRKEGSEFDYESFITKELAKIPVPELPEVFKLLKSIGMVGNSR